jgi:DNA-binding transcriptional LysR family regulator
MQYRTINQTAAALGTAPSSVSDRVRRLEIELGVPLFSRDRAGMHPTGAGRGYLASAARALEILDAAADQLRSCPTLVVGAQASVADDLLPEVLDELRSARPDIEIQLHPDPDRARLFRALDRHEVDVVVLLDVGEHVGDLGFARPPSPTEHLDVREVQMVVVASPNHPFVGRDVTMTEIRQTGGLIGRESRCSFWMAAQRWLGSDVDITAVGGLAQVREWVAEGRGIALLPRFTVRDDLASRRLVELEPSAPPMQLRLVWRQGHEEPQELRRLLYALAGS